MKEWIKEYYCTKARDLACAEVEMRCAHKSEAAVVCVKLNAASKLTAIYPYRTCIYSREMRLSGRLNNFMHSEHQRPCAQTEQRVRTEEIE
jgi:hypothetical protein